MRRLAALVHAALLRLLPRGFRARSGDRMQDLFEWQLGRLDGGWRSLRFVTGSLADVARQAIVMRAGLPSGGSSGAGGPGRGPESGIPLSPGRFPLEPWLREGVLAVRNLVRRPGFTVPVVATLGLGIGMATAMVAVVRGVVLRPLPYPDDDRLVVVRERTERGGLLPASYLNFADWRAAAGSFDGLSAVAGPVSAVVLGGREAERVPALFVSADYFAVSGVAPELGRVHGEEENRPGGAPAVVVSHRFWSESLGGTRELGSVSLTIQDLMGRVESYGVIGVMPADFALMGAADVYLPLDRAVPWNVRGNHVVNVIGRLSAGATLESASSELDRIQAAIRAESGQETEAVGAGVTSLRDEVVGPVRTPVLLLLVGALLLLATSFLNASGALLARGVVRRREFGIRVSLGATRRRVLGQLVLESVFQAAAGVLIGLLLARGLLVVLSSAAPPDIPRLAELATSWRELGLAAAGLVTVGLLLFGVATAAFSTRGDPALRSRSGSHGRGARAVWRVLVAAEVALALMLLATAGVLGRSLRGIITADTGFDADGVLSAQINLPPRQDGELSDIVRYFDVALDEVRALSGVEHVGLSNLLPLVSSSNVGGRVILESGEESDLTAGYRVADGGFFAAMGIRLLSGRVFEERDGPGSAHVVVINRTLAERLFPGGDAIGQRINLGGMDPYRDEWLTVIGIVEEARPWTAAPGSFPVYYVHYRQRPLFLAFTATDIVVRARDASLAAVIRDRLTAIDADVPVGMSTLDARMASRTADRRFVLALLATFALLALLLTAVGIWSIVSFVASRRTRDMGIRLALGASPGRVGLGLQWETGPPVLVGIAAGSILAGSLTRLVRSHLYGVGVFDPVSLGAVALVLAATAWCASWLPARRARRLDPVATLRDS